MNWHALFENPNKGSYLFVTDCVGSTYEDISALAEHEKEISLRTFREAIGVGQWKDLTRNLGYDRDFSISRDWHVGYYRGVYRGVPAVYLRHSRIEYIFTLDGKVGRSLEEVR